MAGSVQFVGKDQVMQLFENKKVDAWSIFQYKQLIHKGTGEEELSAFLDMLAAGGSGAVYTLKLYEGVTDLTQVKEKTDCDGSYNFKLNGERNGEIGGMYYRPAGSNQELIKRIEQLEAERNQPIEEEEETIQEAIGSAMVDVIKDPEKARQWWSVIQDILKGNNTTPPAPPRPVSLLQPAATMGNAQPTITPAGTAEERYDRLIAAITILEANDPMILEHLEKLAKLSQDKPAKFKSLLTMLETFL